MKWHLFGGSEHALDVKASDAGISLSKVLQDALKERLGV